MKNYLEDHRTIENILECSKKCSKTFGKILEVEEPIFWWVLERLNVTFWKEKILARSSENLFLPFRGDWRGIVNWIGIQIIWLFHCFWQVCPICLGRYENNDELRELPCCHFFHKECVDKWLKINAVCPLCKREVGESFLGLLSGTNANPAVWWSFCVNPSEAVRWVLDLRFSYFSVRFKCHSLDLHS